MMTYPKASAVTVPPAGYAGARIPDAVHLPAPYGAQEGLLGRKHVPGEALECTLMCAVVAELATRMTVQEVHTGNGRYTVVVRTGAAFQRFVDGFACADYLPRPGVRARMGLGLPAPVVAALYLLWHGEQREQALACLEAHDGAALMAEKVAALPMSNANFWLWDCIRCGVCSEPQVRIRDELCFHCRFAQEAPDRPPSPSWTHYRRPTAATGCTSIPTCARSSVRPSTELVRSPRSEPLAVRPGPPSCRTPCSDSHPWPQRGQDALDTDPIGGDGHMEHRLTISVDPSALRRFLRTSGIHFGHLVTRRNTTGRGIAALSRRT